MIAFLATGMVLLIALANGFVWFSGVIPFFAYFVCGFLMNRLVLRGLIEWHPVYNTIQNISSSKLRSLFCDAAGIDANELPFVEMVALATTWLKQTA